MTVKRELKIGKGPTRNRGKDCALGGNEESVSQRGCEEDRRSATLYSDRVLFLVQSSLVQVKDQVRVEARWLAVDFIGLESPSRDRGRCQAVETFVIVVNILGVHHSSSFVHGDAHGECSATRQAARLERWLGFENRQFPRLFIGEKRNRIDDGGLKCHAEHGFHLDCCTIALQRVKPPLADRAEEARGGR